VKKEKAESGKHVCWVRAWGAAVLRPYMRLIHRFELRRSIDGCCRIEARLFIAEGLDGI
jgi:hypothetical protein